MPDAPDNTPHASAGAQDASPVIAGGDQRIALMTGDRICIHCTYNLIGQPIIREQHYGLLIVRCPECGRATPTQEYPLLGKWASRLGTLLAGLWLLLLISLLLGTGMAIFGLSLAATEVGLQEYWQFLSSEHNNWRNVNLNAGPTALSFESWYTSQDQAQLLTDAGGLIGVLDQYMLLPLFAMMLLVPILGAMWSVIFITRKRGGLILLALAIWLIAMAVSSIMIVDTLAMDPIWAGRAAWRQLGIWLLPAAVTFSFPCLLIGMAAGRPMMRWLVKVMLPPRMWCRMAWLWTHCDLDPPKPGR